MDIHLKFTEICRFFRPKKTFGKHFGSKNVGSKKFWGSKNFVTPSPKSVWAALKVFQYQVQLKINFYGGGWTSITTSNFVEVDIEVGADLGNTEEDIFLILKGPENTWK